MGSNAWIPCKLSVVLCVLVAIVFWLPYASAQPTSTSLASPQPCPSGATDELCKAYHDGDCDAALSPDLCAAKLKAERGNAFVHWLTSNGVLEPLLGLLAGVALVVIALLKGKLTALAARLGDPMLVRGEQRNFDTRGVNLVIVGEGGTGKTSIVRALSGSQHAAPSRSTHMPATYCIVHEVDVDPEDEKTAPVRMLERLYANDYQGQRAAQLMKSDLAAREKFIPSTVMVIVVDMRPPGILGGDPVVAMPTIDKARVREQCDAYPDNLLEILFGLCGHLKQIVLFINKIDLLRPFDDQTDEAIRKAYAPLIKRLAIVGRQFEFSVILGAAARGDGIVGFDPSNPTQMTLYETAKKMMVPIKMPRSFLFLGRGDD